MCGRYAIDDETAREIEKLIREVDAALKQERLQLQPFKAGDIHPTDHAPVLVAEKDVVRCRMLQWGLPGFAKEGSGGKASVLFNARCETALEKPAFRDGIRNRRAVIPAKWFYEWNPL